jgi:replicative DNA helicase
MGDALSHSAAEARALARQLREEAQAVRAETRQRRRRRKTSEIERALVVVARELKTLDAALDQLSEDGGSADDLDARARAVEARLSEIEKALRLLRARS